MPVITLGLSPAHSIKESLALSSHTQMDFDTLASTGGYQEEKVHSVPKFQNLDTGPMARILIQLASKLLVTPSRLRKWANESISQGGNGKGVRPPHALNVRDMAAATWDIMVPGPSPLVSPQINSRECCRLHIRSCDLCRASGSVAQNCYFVRIAEVLERGWSPPFEANEVRSIYSGDNGIKTAAFPAAVVKSVNKLVELKKVHIADEVKCISGVNLVFKNVDILWAKSHGMGLSDDNDVIKVNNARAEESLPPIKIRMVHDYTGSGLNGAQQKVRYSNIGLDDVIEVLYPNCYVSIGDLKSYYESYGVSEDMSKWFAFEVFGILYRATCIMFGFSLAPAFCATLTAEILSWITMAGIVAIAMTDDFLLVSQTAAESKKDMRTVVELLRPCGYVFAEDKFQLGSQCFIFIGFVVDTVNLTVSFHKSGVKAYLSVLESALRTFKGSKSLPKAEIESLAGKLNNYAILIQQGRVHIHQLWRIAHNRNLIKVKEVRKKLIVDLEFWFRTLSNLSRQGHLPMPFPILSAHDIAKDPNLVIVVRSDASGLVGSIPELDGGWGFIAGHLLDANPVYKFGRWNGKYSFGAHSHHGELTVLLIFLETSYDQVNVLDVNKSKARLVFWVTDCSGAAWSINKGHCRSEESIDVLSEILQICDEKRIWIVALWWPREQGLLEDFLTHLSSLINRDCGEGTVDGLASNASASFTGNRQQAKCNNGQEEGKCVRSLRKPCQPRKDAVSNNAGHTVGLSVPASEAEQRKCKVIGLDCSSNESAMPDKTGGLVR